MVRPPWMKGRRLFRPSVSTQNIDLAPMFDTMGLTITDEYRKKYAEGFYFEFDEKRRCEPDTIPCLVYHFVKKAVEIMNRPGGLELETNEFHLRLAEARIDRACKLYRSVMPFGWKYERENARKILEEYVTTFREEHHTWISKLPQAMTQNRRRMSEVWKHFVTVENDVGETFMKVECVHCKKKYNSTIGGATTTLKRHLKSCPVMRRLKGTNQSV
ncbi:hypothetical protein SSX86_027254 [Deinandra increscens subsp. villosa]|uniref:BED-type domain-containing protein n=1 Tax=Deinandra increscens subsp. villosa TaxID=3103831 RepID=A0AAP0CLI1_9ASTR